MAKSGAQGNSLLAQKIGSRLRLRDLEVFFAVVECGSMAKAAAQLGITQPSVSEVIAGLEHAVHARLFDRSVRGVQLTPYGEALLRRGRAAMDELRHGVRELEHLADPSAGEVRIGCAEVIAPGLLPAIIEVFSAQYPGVALKIAHITANPPDLGLLRERELDLILAPQPMQQLEHDFAFELLMSDRIHLVVGPGSRWAGKRKVGLADLLGDPWILAPVETPATRCVTAAYQALGLDAPVARIEAYSFHIRNQLLAIGPYVSVMTTTVLRRSASHFGLTALPILLPDNQFPIGAITVQRRVPAAIVETFLHCARQVAKKIEAKAA
ncbi:MAG: LysR family transcriptional regulator [Betaproteobacteria bacterium]|nr:LysR family transcriptional regulator [Betaproteobacteria bacterium]